MGDVPSLLALCADAYYATDGWTRQDNRTRWVMDIGSYKQLRADCEELTGHRTDPETWVPDPGDRLFGIAIDVRDDGGQPHLEAPVSWQPPMTLKRLTDARPRT